MRCIDTDNCERLERDPRGLCQKGIKSMISIASYIFEDIAEHKLILMNPHLS